MSKRCSKCEKDLPPDKFCVNRATRDGLNYKCRACAAEYAKSYKQTKHAKELRNKAQRKYNATPQGKKKLRSKNLKRAFGITLEDYDYMFEGQNGECAICGKREVAKNQYGTLRLAVDHDHKTGKVRGLLCQRCNFVIGHAHDDAGVLLKALFYIEENR